MLKVVDVVEQFLRGKVAEFESPSYSVAIGMLNDALKFKEEWEGRDTLLLELTDNLLGKLSAKQYLLDKNFPIVELSKEALEYLLLERKQSCQRKDKSKSAREYHNFRRIVEWLVHKYLPTSVLEVPVSEKLQGILPIEETEALLWNRIDDHRLSTCEVSFTSSKASGLHDPTTVLNSRLGSHIPKEHFERLLKHIAWRQIPALLLLKVIRPLEVLSPYDLSDALSFHALHRSLPCFSVRTWKCSKTLTYASNGGIICRSESGSRSAGGRALAILPTSRSSGTYEWNLRILRSDADDILFGIIFGLDNAAWEKHGLEERSLTSCPATRLLKIKREKGIISREDKELKCLMTWEKVSRKSGSNYLPYPEAYPPTRFTLDRFQNTCHVSLAGEFLIKWTGLPDAVFHPVIEIFRASFVQAEIEACRGFHYW